MKKAKLAGWMVLALFVCGAARAQDALRIGLIWDHNIPISESNPYEAVEMIRERVNGSGGLRVGDRFYRIDLVYQECEYRGSDNAFSFPRAAEATVKLITEGRVFAVLGPVYGGVTSGPVAEACNAFETPNINYMSYFPDVVANKPWIFQLRNPVDYWLTGFCRFLKEELNARTAAVVYNVEGHAPREHSAAFIREFERLNGKGSVVAIEATTAKDSREGNYDPKSLKGIVAARPDVLYTPIFLSQSVLLMKKLRALAYRGCFVSTFWGNEPATISKNLDVCKGAFFTSTFESTLATGLAKRFVDDFTKRYSRLPEYKAALAWDGMNLLLQAIRNTGGLTGDLKKDQKAVRDQLLRTRGFEGVTTTISYDGKTGSSRGSVQIYRITGSGSVELVKSMWP